MRILTVLLLIALLVAACAAGALAAHKNFAALVDRAAEDATGMNCQVTVIREVPRFLYATVVCQGKP